VSRDTDPQDKPLSTVVLRCFTPNADLCTSTTLFHFKCRFIQKYYVVSLQMQIYTQVLRCFTSNADLYTEGDRSLVLQFKTLPLVSITKDSRKRRFLKSTNILIVEVSKSDKLNHQLSLTALKLLVTLILINSTKSSSRKIAVSSFS